MEWKGQILKTRNQIFAQAILVRSSTATDFLVQYMKSIQEENPELTVDEVFFKARDSIRNFARSYSLRLRQQIEEKFNF